MSDDHEASETEETADLTLRDGQYLARLMPILRLVVKTWFRSRVLGMEKVPDGGVLLVSNHSGGLLAMDVPVIAVAFVDHFGIDRPIYVLAHDILFSGPTPNPFPKAGFVPANRRNAAAVLRAGGVTIVFPGGDHEVFRPSSERNKIDFAGRTGYVRTAIEADVPIVPVVSIGGHEDQIHLARGERLAKILGLDKRLRTKYVPVTFGFPFGLTLAFPANLPLPTKIDTRVLDPIHIREEFGDEPDVADVDRLVRARMQSALDDLAKARRFPVLG
ncbi:MAG TPA: lysophospholipid acyltransferase family protein [Nocardioidaceae bacterium]|nr:lysophospholipid acyltransferase family protein [Nocardioidaceae bacterium]